jgi:hypothetical protein
MRTIIIAVMLTAAAASASAQTPRSAGTCRANQSGGVLLTSVEYADGYRVEAPWRVLSSQVARNGNASMTATLDHIIETNPATGKRHRTPLPGTIEMTFEGENGVLLLREAADVWCSTVAKALSAQEADAQSRVAQHRVVM